MRLLLFTFFAAAISVARADTHSELTAALARFTGESEVRAGVSYEYWSEAGDKDGMVEETCTVSVGIAEDADGLRVTWSRGTLADAAEEVRAASVDGEVKTPMRRAMGLLSATVLSGYLNGAIELSRWLGQSELLREEAAEWKGAPARLLIFNSTPRVNAQTRKYLKELEATVRVWVGKDGVPLAAERSVQFKGRAFLVVSFASDESDAYEFSARGDRLVVVRHERVSHGTGTGGKNAQKTVAMLTLAPE
ncbi:MAG TPA: hypothetical protein VMM36_10955 [Opitutaceae bacterium]|nr:hypothetical protein [Opitutaceae bacterium]